MSDVVGNFLRGAGLVITVTAMLISAALYVENGKREADVCVAGLKTEVEKNTQSITVLQQWVRDNREMPEKVTLMTEILKRIDNRMERFENRVMEKD